MSNLEQQRLRNAIRKVLDAAREFAAVEHLATVDPKRPKQASKRKDKAKCDKREVADAR